MGARSWRAPAWSPLWLRRLFPGVWTQAEVDRIRQQAKVDAEDIQRWVS